MGKKISLITLHRVTNFGSLLQTYATQNYLEQKGYTVEVIDFVPEGLSFRRAIWPKNTNIVKQLIKLLPLFIVNIIQFRMCDSFLKRNIHLTGKRYTCFESLQKEPPIADFYLSGSDQIWNTQNSNKANDIQAYFLDFVQDIPKVAYAGSFGKTELTDGESDDICRWLKSYKAISVREDQAKEMLSKIGIKAEHVLDPTLLLDSNDWKRFFGSEFTPIRRYVFVYNLNRNKTLELAAKKIAREKNLAIINFADSLEFIKGAKNLINNTPYDFLRYMSAAEYVVTDSFHGTAFSLNFGKQFLVVQPPKYSVRLESILRLAGCEDRVFNDENEALKISNKVINYGQVTPKLSEARRKSEMFLNLALEG